MTITDAIARARELAGKATPGPFRTHRFPDSIYNQCDVVDSRGDCLAIMDSCGGMIGPDQIKGNAEFFADARESYPRAIDALEKAEAALKAIESGLVDSIATAREALAAIESKLRGEG